jgi:hypothetical protein
MTQQRLHAGDVVAVKSPEEILQTLDTEGTLNQLPFMPEMLGFCGRSFRVAQRVEMTCASGMDSPRGFLIDDVVTLEGVRCSGAAHDGCQKACAVFWRESWLRKVEEDTPQSMSDPEGDRRLRARLKVMNGKSTYFCQASELARVTYSLSRSQRVRMLLSGLRAGNFSIWQMASGIGIWAFWRVRQLVLGIYMRGTNKTSPAENLNLQPGEWVEVKTRDGVVETLNERRGNRGLMFFPGMHLFCGRRYRVKGRLDRLIADGTGEMRKLKNTVLLDGVTCRCSYLGFGVGGCSRCEYAYWREIWLRRVDDAGEERLHAANMNV